MEGLRNIFSKMEGQPKKRNFCKLKVRCKHVCICQQFGVDSGSLNDHHLDSCFYMLAVFHFKQGED